MEAVLNGPLGPTTLGNSPLRLGRAPDSDIVLQDSQASARHAEIAPGPDGTNYILTDLGSTNGTFVNGQRLVPQTQRPLRSGDTLLIGSQNFTFEVTGPVDATIRAGSPALDELLAQAQPPSPQVNPQQTPQEPGAFPLYPSPPIGYPAPLPEQKPVHEAAIQADATLRASQSEEIPGSPQEPTRYAALPQSGSGNIPAPTPFAGQQPGYIPQPPVNQPPTSGWPSFTGTNAPGTWNPPVQAPPQKSNTNTIVIVAIVLVAVVGSGIFGIWFMNRSTPEKTLGAYCLALQNSDAQSIFDLSSRRVQAESSVDEIQQGLGFITAFLGPIESCTPSNIQINGNTATATLTLILKKDPNKPQDSNGPLIFEDNTWKIDSDVDETDSSNNLPEI